MQELLKYAINISNNQYGKGATELEYRDRTVKAAFKCAPDQVYDKDAIEEWIGDLCRSVVSTTFHHYLNGNMTFEQAKVFCCEEILKNISEFGERYELTSDLLKLSDKIMKEKVMPYLALKYPLNESTNVNKSLNRVVKEINNNEVLSNDFLYNSDIVVEYR